MNIHISREDFNKLYFISCNYQVGSAVYNHDRSIGDNDYVIIANTPSMLIKNGLLNSSMLQYKDEDENSDYVITYPEQIMYNLINMDSTVIFEFVFKYLFKYDIEGLITYDVLKAYLGLVKRDLKSNSEKKLYHACRGISFVKQMLYESKLDFTYQIMSKDQCLHEYNILRNEINYLLDNGKIQKTFSINTIKLIRDKLDHEIDTTARDISESNKITSSEEIWFKHIHKSLEIGIKY